MSVRCLSSFYQCLTLNQILIHVSICCLSRLCAPRSWRLFLSNLGLCQSSVGHGKDGSEKRKPRDSQTILSPPELARHERLGRGVGKDRWPGSKNKGPGKAGADNIRKIGERKTDRQRDREKLKIKRQKGRVLASHKSLGLTYHVPQMSGG